jgi:phosphoribosylformylglycinamidine synthase
VLGLRAAGDVAVLRDVWEATSFRLEREQSAEETVEAERSGLAAREAPRWRLPFTPTWTPNELLSAPDKPRIAVLRSAHNPAALPIRLPLPQCPLPCI